MNNFLKCHACDKHYAEKTALLSHFVSEHSENREFKCGACGDAFSQRGNLKIHVEKEHTDQNNKEILLKRYMVGMKLG